MGEGKGDAWSDRDGFCRRRLAPETRKAEVLAAALDVFAELGFERATLQDVADRAGVTKGALYHYFDSKDQLFLELMRERVAAHVCATRMRITAAGPTKPKADLLRELLEAIWINLQQPGLLELMRLMMSELPKFPEVRRSFFEEIVVPARRAVRNAWIAERGDDEADAAVDAITALLPGMLLGVGLTRRMFQEIDPMDLGAERTGQLVIDLLVRGAMAPSW